VDSGAAAGTIESGMTHITGQDRDQMLLLPEASARTVLRARLSDGAICMPIRS
jgi:hypothetical protein